MKPTFLHRSLANSAQLVLIGSGIYVEGMIAWYLYETYWVNRLPLIFYPDACEIAAAVVGCFPLTYLILAVTIGPVISTVVAKINGAPFQIGDWVYILKGLHRNELTRVYEVWAGRCQVRLEIGDKARDEVKDVFWYTDVYRDRKRARDTAADLSTNSR